MGGTGTEQRWWQQLFPSGKCFLESWETSGQRPPSSRCGSGLNPLRCSVMASTQSSPHPRHEESCADGIQLGFLLPLKDKAKSPRWRLVGGNPRGEAFVPWDLGILQPWVGLGFLQLGDARRDALKRREHREGPGAARGAATPRGTAGAQGPVAWALPVQEAT